MARIHYTTLLPDDLLFTKEYPEIVSASKVTKNGFELHDPDGNYLNYISVRGTGLTYKHGYLVGGTITGVEFRDGNGEDYLTIDHAHYKVTEKLDLAQTAPALIYLAAETGNDKIVGSTESDLMFSTAGTDRLIGLYGDDTLVAYGKATMTGNMGSDTFVFSGFGKVKITDFDAVGGGEKQDYVYFTRQDDVKPRVYEHHHNTVIDFGHGQTVTLLNVDRADFSLVDDFKEPAAFEMM